MRSLSVVAVVTLVLATVLVPVAAVGGASATQSTLPGVGTGAAPPPVPAAADQPAVDDTVTRIELATNGTAVWELAYQTRLQTDAEVADYRTFQSEFRNDTATFETTFRERIGAVVADATNETGREMAVTNVTATTAIRQVPRRIGVVTYRFRWTGFAETDGDRVVAGDVFEGGYYLADNDSLVVVAPSDYVVDRATPTPSVSDERQVRWTGRLSFADGRPLVAARPADTPTRTATRTRTRTPTPATVTTGPATAGGDGGGGVPWLLVGAVALVLAAVVALAVRGGGPFGGDGSFGGGTRSDGTPPDDGAPPDGTGGTGTHGADVETRGGDGEADTSTGGAGGESGATSAGDESTTPSRPSVGTTATGDGEPTAADAATADAIAAGDGTDEHTDSDSGTDDDEGLPEPYASVLDGIRPPLTDAERVERALARERGRMRQSALADELDWSASKTSRVLSDMESDDRIEKIRVGRENVVDLAVDEADDTG
ncbi:DUF4897 domain-containing protein [Halobaculum sp. MBLA0147]|uniref:DUF7345 domain-containing protein n=1 Tax=Halobaculum sp. MBLA0147 TaxID=3079934 RepID=UPI0035238A07